MPGEIETATPPPGGRVCVVGLGLIGESLALALRSRHAPLELYGIDRDAVARDAQARHVVDHGISLDDAAAVKRAFTASELVVLAAPVSAIRSWLPLALSHAALVTDCGSTKRSILNEARAHARAGRFVPGHPMAGVGGGGVASAHAELFVGQPWVLCPEGVDADALAAVSDWVSGLGARVVRFGAAAHDAAVAVTSHAPRLVASVLTGLAEQADAFEAAGPAFERLSRGAGGSAGVWSDVLDSNRDEVARVLRHLVRKLEACADELEQGTELTACLETLATAELARRAFASRRR